MGVNQRSSSSGWTRKVRSLAGNMMGGFRGGSNVASWAVAATLAYFLWVKPSQDLKRQQQERVAAAAALSTTTATDPQAQEPRVSHGGKKSEPSDSRT